MSEFDVIYAPKEGKTQRIAVSTTGDTTALGDEIKGIGWVRVKASVACDVKFGPSTMTQTEKDATGDGDTVAPEIAAGTYEDFYLTGEDTHVSWDAADAGFITIQRAGRTRVKNG